MDKKNSVRIDSSKKRRGEGDGSGRIIYIYIYRGETSDRGHEKLSQVGRSLLLSLSLPAIRCTRSAERSRDDVCVRMCVWMCGR